MDDQAKTKQQLIDELTEMRRRLSKMEVGYPVTEICEAKRAEEALRKSEERLELALKGADLGLWDYNLKTGDAYINERRAEMVGYSVDELGPHISSWGKLVHPDDRDRVTNAFNGHLQGRRPLYECEHRLRHKSGEYIWVLARAKVVEWDHEGYPLRLVGTSLDITDRKRAEEALHSARNALEIRVEERTAELRESNEQLQEQIAECKHVEEALRESEERFAFALEGAEIGVWDWNLTTGKAGWGYRTFERLGYLPGEIEPDIKTWKHLVHPQDWLQVSKTLNDHLRGYLPMYECEHRTRTKSGDWLWVLARGKVVERDRDGRPVRMLGTSLDITARKRAENALRESEEKYRALVQNAHEGILVAQDGIHKFVNPALAKIYGQSQATLLSRPFREFIHPDDRDMVLDRSVRRAKGEKLPSRYPFRIVTKEGTTRWVEIDSAAISWEGKPAVLVFMTDITERKRMEKAIKERDEQYQSLVEESFDGIMVTKETKIVFVNSRLCQMLGYSKEELEGMDHWLTTDTDYQHLVEQRALARMHGESVPPHYEVKLKRSDGSAFDAEVISRAIELQGSPGVQVWMKDITERKQAEQALRESEKKLLQAQKMEAIGTLTSGIAHDFNNLLTIMNGYTEMILMDKTEDDPLYADLQKILQTGLKGADMVQRLLSFTKQAATKPEPMDLNHRIDETKKLMDRTFPKTIEIETNLPDDLEMVNADAGQMDQLLMNLCVNAKDAMPDGGRLRIETRNITVDEEYCRLHIGAKPGRHVLIEIADTGIGMSKETMDRMFDPFFTTKGWDFKKGTGLGLSVAKGIVEQHGGWMACESEAGKGTTFTVFFPVIKDSPAVEKHDPIAESVPGNEKILLVDDEECMSSDEMGILRRRIRGECRPQKAWG